MKFEVKADSISDGKAEETLEEKSGKKWLKRLIWQLPLLAVVLYFGSLVQTKLDERMDNVIPETVAFCSTKNKKPSGYSALYELFQKVKLEPKQWIEPYRELTQQRGILLVVSPSYPLREFECDQILSWVAAGNQLVYLDYCMYGAGSRLLERLNLDARVAKAGSDVLTAALPAIPEMANVKRLALSSETRLKGGTVLVQDGQGALLVEAKYGKGRCLVGTLPSFCANRRISDTANWGNFQFMLNWVRSSDGSVLFDERVHGFTASQNVFVHLSRQPLGLMVAQLVLIFVIALASLNQRFGRLHVHHEKRKIASSEFIDGMARTYSKAHAYEAALHILYGSFRQRLCKALSLAPSENAELVAQTWAQSAPVKVDEARAFLREADNLAQQSKIKEEDLVKTMNECDRLYEQSKSSLAVHIRRIGV